MPLTSGRPSPAQDRVAFHSFMQRGFFAVGIAITGRLWLRPSWVLVALGLVAVLCGLAALRAQRVMWLPLALLWCLLGAWCAQMEPHPAPAPALAGLSDGLLRTVEGTVVDAGAVRGEAAPNTDEPAFTEPTQLPPERPSQRVDVRVSSVEVVTDAGDAQKAAAGAVRLTIRWPEANALHSPEQAITPFYCGDRIRAVARLLPPETYHDPGAWSRAAYLLDQGITSTASVNIERVERSGTSSEASLACRIGSWQRASSGRLLALPAAMHGLLPRCGLRSKTPSCWQPWLPATARISATLCAWDSSARAHFTCWWCRAFTWRLWRGASSGLRNGCGCRGVPATLVTIFASLAYALFTGFATPVQRSLWMVTLYLLGRVLYRERSPLNTIGFAALCLMAASPRSLFDASLQMTLLAVVSIGGIAAPLLQGTMHPYLVAARDLRLIAIDAKLAPELAQFRVTLRMVALRLQAAISRRFAWSVFPWDGALHLARCRAAGGFLRVELAMTLPMAVYFHRITIFALPVNLLILPLLAILMPAALVTLLALLLWPAAAMVPGAIAAVLLHFGVGLVHVFGSMALGDFRIPTPLAAQSAAFACCLRRPWCWLGKADGGAVWHGPRCAGRRWSPSRRRPFSIRITRC